MSNLLKCPRCKLDAREVIVGEMLGEGTIAIARQRSKYSYEEATIVTGDNFQLMCGYCRTPVYVRKEETYADSGYKWITRIHFISLNQGTIRQEVQGSENFAGTALFA